jgi:glutamate-1-semialdehyde 2,1-aminomutase
MSRKTDKSHSAFERAKKVLVGGVNSPVRAFSAVGGCPPVIAEAAGVYLTDLDGNRYVDYVCGYGPAILGHAHPAVVQAVAEATARGTCYGAPTEAETHLAEKITAAFPTVQKLRMTNSGTEAVMSAVRLARGATGRRKIVKCIGCYHGHADALLVSAGSGSATLNVPSSAGVPAEATAHTLVVPYNDLSAMKKAFDAFGGDMAAVLIEPVAANMGVVPPGPGYLEGLRRLCDRHGALLIFDEVITGFRIARGGAQELYGVRADLTALGKIIGGGLPAGAFGGRDDLMAHLAPQGAVYQAGTLSGGPAVTAAGLATLKVLEEEGFYTRLEKTSAELERGLRQAARSAGLESKVCFNRVGSLLCCFFAPGPVRDFQTASAGHAAAFAAYFHAMLEGGIYLAPSPFEAMFVSAVHGREEIQRTVETAAGAFSQAARAGWLME